MKTGYKHITDRAEFARSIKAAGHLTISIWSEDRNDEGQYASCSIHLPVKVAVADVMRGAYDGFEWNVDAEDGTAWLRHRHAPREVRLARRIDLLTRQNAHDAKLVEGVKDNNADWVRGVHERIARSKAELTTLRARAVVTAVNAGETPAPLQAAA
jgi:hypothetical protein